MRIAKLITGTIARIVRDVTEAPAVARELRQRRTAQTVQSAKPAPLTADDIKGEVPEVADIEIAARFYEAAREDGNAASRLKRRAEKVLGKTPDGVYGAVTVERFESSRKVADLDAIKAIFAANGLGDIPMKTCSASLVLTWSEAAADYMEAARELIPVAA
jgi:hypothetical protein